jgi:hypothetical protein
VRGDAQRHHNRSLLRWKLLQRPDARDLPKQPVRRVWRRQSAVLRQQRVPRPTHVPKRNVQIGALV